MKRKKKAKKRVTPSREVGTKPFTFQATGDRDNPSISVYPDACPTLPANPMSDRGVAVCVPEPMILDEYNQTGHDICYPLRTATGDGIPKVAIHGVKAFAQNARSEVRLIGGDGKIAAALGTPGMNQTTYVTYDMRGRGEGKTVNTLCTDHASRPSDFCPIIIAQGATVEDDIFGSADPMIFQSRVARNGRGAPEPICPALRAQETGDASPLVLAFDTTQVTCPNNYSKPKPGDPCHPLASGAHAPAVAFSIMPQNSGKDYKAREVKVAQPLMAAGPGSGAQGGDVVLHPKEGAVAFKVAHFTRGKDGAPSGITPPLTARAEKGDTESVIHAGQATSVVRRLTPEECEALQGFPRGYTRIPWRGNTPEDCPDGPRYKAMGNSMAVPVMRWIGERLQAVEDELNGKVAAPSVDDLL